MLNLLMNFLLDRDLKILFLLYPGRDRSVTASGVSNTYQFITLPLCLNPALTWSIVILLRMHDLPPLLYKA